MYTGICIYWRPLELSRHNRVENIWSFYDSLLAYKGPTMMTALKPKLTLLAILLAFVLAVYGAGVNIEMTWLEDGNAHRKVKANVDLVAPCDMPNTWSVMLRFSEQSLSFETWTANNGESCVNTRQCELVNKWPSNLKAGDKLNFQIQVKFNVQHIPELHAEWGNVCGNKPPTGVPPTGSPPKTPKPIGGKYNYADVLGKSIMFYEAQRSGKLPANNRIKYRGDSALGDGRDVGLDLTGGWYDAGDHVKFNFPMASSVTMLALGMIKYKAGYEAAGEWQNGLSCIKWPLDYLLKCHSSKNELYMQVGDGDADHANWGRPEDLNMARPSFKVTPGKPGSDVAGETAAAMAAGSIIFKDIDAGYAANLLSHAKDIYNFAKTYKGKYSDSIPQVRDFYGSNGYVDELAWAAAWLHRATGEAGYLAEAKGHLGGLGTPGELSWDDKAVAAALLIYEADKGDAKAKGMVEGFVSNWLNNVKRTPRGLAWLRKWGPNRYSANSALVLLLAGDLGIETQRTKDFAFGQVNYMLGDGGRSYVCGFGNNPPQRPHHKAASCPWRPAGCSWNDFNSGAPNPHVLYGALVGGPGENDDYEDRRNDYVKNEVATDYNAAFQSVLAGLVTKL